MTCVLSLSLHFEFQSGPFARGEVVAPRTNPDEIPLTEALACPQMAYSVASSQFSDVATYPLFSRTVPSDTLLCLNLASLLQFFRWSSFAMITQRYADAIRHPLRLQSSQCLGFARSVHVLDNLSGCRLGYIRVYDILMMIYSFMISPRLGYTHLQQEFVISQIEIDKIPPKSIQLYASTISGHTVGCANQNSPRIFLGISVHLLCACVLRCLIRDAGWSISAGVGARAYQARFLQLPHATS